MEKKTINIEKKTFIMNKSNFDELQSLVKDYANEINDENFEIQKLEEKKEILIRRNELLKNKLREYEKKINILTREKEEAILKLKEEKK